MSEVNTQRKQGQQNEVLKNFCVCPVVCVCVWGGGGGGGGGGPGPSPGSATDMVLLYITEAI